MDLGSFQPLFLQTLFLLLSLDAPTSRVSVHLVVSTFLQGLCSFFLHFFSLSLLAENNFMGD